MATVEIIYDGPVPPHRQIAAWLRDRIRAGEFGTDQRLPTQDAIVQELGVAATTVRRALALLREEGWIYTVPARGSFVSADRPG
jgi:DNA-binding GntR family transcriptional regulator